MSRERYPIQDGPSVPWEFMAPHEAQARKNHGQTLERLAERGGLGCAEAWVIVHGLKHMDILHEEHKRKWIELAERVNREWSIERLLAEERERVREMCDEGLSCMKDNLEVKEAEASAVTDGLYEKGRVSGLTIALGVIRGLDLTKDLAPSTEEHGKPGV